MGHVTDGKARRPTRNQVRPKAVGEVPAAVRELASVTRR